MSARRVFLYLVAASLLQAACAGSAGSSVSAPPGCAGGDPACNGAAEATRQDAQGAQVPSLADRPPPTGPRADPAPPPSPAPAPPAPVQPVAAPPAPAAPAQAAKLGECPGFTWTPSKLAGASAARPAVGDVVEQYRHLDVTRFALGPAEGDVETRWEVVAVAADTVTLKLVEGRYKWGFDGEAYKCLGWVSQRVNSNDYDKRFPRAGPTQQFFDEYRVVTRRSPAGR